MKLYLYLFFLIVCSNFLAAQDWGIYTNEPHGFSIYSPAELVAHEEQAMTDLGTIKVHSFGHLPKKDAADENLVYQIIIYEYPDDAIHPDSIAQHEDILNDLVLATVENSQGELLYMELNQYRGANAVIWKIATEQDIYIKARALVSDNKVYITQVMTNKNKSLNQKVNKYLDSFQLIKTESTTK